MFFCGSSLLLCPRSEERRVLSEEDKILENAKWGVGLAAVLGKIRKYKRFFIKFRSSGGLFVVKKILKK